MKASRRHLLVGGGWLLAGACTSAGRPSPGAGTRLRALEAGLDGGRLGVAALDLATGARLQHRADERFSMASTFKWLLAAAVLNRVDGGAARLDQQVAFTEKDLFSYAPVTRAHVGEGSLSLAALCSASVALSDNTAANLLLAEVGGPRGLTAFLRRSGDATTRLDRIEPALNANSPGDVRDTTTPRAMIANLRRLLVDEGVLSAGSRVQLQGWMDATSTGLARLRAGVPAAWKVGDKTGTGEHGANNDVAIVRPPGRKPILVACYTSEGAADGPTREAVQASVGRLIAEMWS